MKLTTLASNSLALHSNNMTIEFCTSDLTCSYGSTADSILGANGASQWLQHAWQSPGEEHTNSMDHQLAYDTKQSP